MDFSCVGTSGCWTRVEAGTGRLEPLGASQELRLDKVLYQEGGEYRCVAPNRDLTRRLDSLRNALSVQLIVTGKFKFFFSSLASDDLNLLTVENFRLKVSTLVLKLNSKHKFSA